MNTEASTEVSSNPAHWGPPPNRRERRANRAQQRRNMRKLVAARGTVTRIGADGETRIDSAGCDRLAARFGIPRAEAVAIAGSMLRHGVKR